MRASWSPSIGLYSQVFQDREHYKRLYGRRRVVAAGAAVMTMLRASRHLELQLDCDGTREQVRALTLFVGNNPLQLDQVGLPEAEAVQHRRLAGVLAPPMSTWALLGIALSGAMGRLGDSDKVRNFAFRKMTVTPIRRVGPKGLRVAFDGELQWMQPPVEFSVAPQTLMLLTPEPEPASST